MAGDTRTLKLAILAETRDLVQGLNKADNEVSSFADKLGKFGKVAGAAFAAAGVAAVAYASKLAVDGVKAAIEDEAAQAKLALTLKNVANATDATVASTEDYITKTTLATGIADDQLRPSLERLVRATGDVTKAQQLQQLALDISAGSGKSLEAVSNALGKAYEGNATALGKLGVGLSAAELKSMSFDEVTKKLSDTFAGQAIVQADTFEGKMARLNIAFSEAKETVGAYILDALTPLVTEFVDKVIPKAQEVAGTLGEKLGPAFKQVAEFVRDVLIPVVRNLWTFFTQTLVPAILSILGPALSGLFKGFNTVAQSIKDNEDKLRPLFDAFKVIASFIATTLAPIVGTTLGLAFRALGSAISTVVNVVSNLINLFSTLIAKVYELARAVANSPVGQAVGGLLDGFRANGGPVTAGGTYMVGERGPELFVPRTSGTIMPNNALGGNTININVSGAIDPTAVARQLNNLFEREASLSGGFTNFGRSNLVTV